MIDTITARPQSTDREKKNNIFITTIRKLFLGVLIYGKSLDISWLCDIWSASTHPQPGSSSFNIPLQSFKAMYGTFL